jgi:hypothetical protein
MMVLTMMTKKEQRKEMKKRGMERKRPTSVTL